MRNKFVALIVAMVFLLASLGIAWVLNTSLEALGLFTATELYLAPALLVMTGIVWASIESQLEGS